jgi:hypothetical protein
VTISSRRVLSTLKLNVRNESEHMETSQASINQLEGEPQIPQARATRAHKGCELAAFHAGEEYPQRGEHREQSGRPEPETPIRVPKPIVFEAQHDCFGLLARSHAGSWRTPSSPSTTSGSRCWGIQENLSPSKRRVLRNS